MNGSRSEDMFAFMKNAPPEPPSYHPSTDFATERFGATPVPAEVRAAKSHRALGERGVTIRETIDAVIATRCMVSGLRLLHSDRDFEPFERHLGLKCPDCTA